MTIKFMCGYMTLHRDEPCRPYKFTLGYFRNGWHLWRPLAWTRRFYKHELDWTPG